MQNIFFVLKRKISAKEKIKKIFRCSPSLLVLSKVLRLLSRQTMSQSFLTKIKASLTFSQIPFDSPSKSYPFHKGQLNTQGQRGFWGRGSGAPAGSQSSPSGTQNPWPQNAPLSLCVILAAVRLTDLP